MFHWIFQTREVNELFFYLLMFSIGWCICVVPWSFIVFMVFRWRRINQRRTAWLLAPSILMLLTILAKDTYSVRGMFEKVIMEPIPESVSDLKAFGVGGGFGNPQYLLYFRIDPNEFNTVLNSRPFKISSTSFDDIAPFYPSNWISYGWPNLKQWVDAEIYEVTIWNRSRYRIITSKDHQQVFFDVIHI
ncbi:hypothetical protein JW979_13135 [bacterium]|nr:hypothetical protein [candidate division CSSED10-310 bacterium]